MTGWNLPPGVTEDMLPGNRPEDQALDNLFEYAWPCPRCGAIDKAENYATGVVYLPCGHEIDEEEATVAADEYWEGLFERKGEV